jgi:hypothetical protein
MTLRTALAALLLPAVIDLQAQQPAAAGGVGDAGRPLVIREITGDGRVLTPEYQVKRNPQNARVKSWYQITTEYETAPEWVDEVEFTYYVLVKNTKNPKGPPQTVFKGSVTYINVEKGRHKSDMFLHPNTLARYGEVQAVAVMVNVEGRLVALDGKPRTNERWWERLAPMDGLLLPRSETPFAPLYFDDYAPVKRATK